jgi:signal transduction histidine kinase
MHELELLKTIQPIWLDKCAEGLARGSGLREQLRGQLEQFYSSLEQSMDSGDPAWLDPILSSWAGSFTQSDLEAKNSSMVQFIDELMLLTFRVTRETLDASQALNLIGAFTPIFAYAIEKSAQIEIQMKVTFISNKLEQTQQTLERFDRTKSDFIAVAAHELKTPLTLIEGYTAMLRENRERHPLPPNEVVLLNGIQKGTERMHSIIDDMIDVSLIDNNLMKLNFQPVWINRLFSVLSEELSTAIHERSLTLTISPFPGSNEVIFADPDRILQVFRNVLTNAVKYTPDGGKISVDGRKLPGFIEVIISDTGIGIDPEDQPYIFEKFSTFGNISLHSSGKTKFKGGGPGLGLRIAKGIVEAHGGAIWVESPRFDEKDCPGSTFHLLMPHRSTPPDDRMAKLFAPLLQNRSQEE